MAKKKYENEDVLSGKIHQLFEYRKLNELMRLGQQHQNQNLLNHLVHIQSQIYLLDAYLERNWELDPIALNGYWDRISSSLHELGYDTNEHPELLKEIRQYEAIEKNCRKDEWPTSLSFKKFYTIKSCDVRLIRHLIYEEAPELHKTWKEKVWTYYDLITEVNDDISDLQEDVPTYNGNRFLISILRLGVKKTRKQYAAFIKQVVKKANRYFDDHPKQELHRELHEWIRIRSKETLALLDEVTAASDIEQLSTSLLLTHMK